MTIHIPQAVDSLNPEPLIFEAVENASSSDGPSWRALGILTGCVWLGSFLLSTSRDLALGSPGLGGMTLLRLGFAVVGALLCLPLHLLLRRMRRLPVPRQLAASVLASSIAAIVYTDLVFLLTEIGAHATSEADGSWQFYNTVYWAVFFLAWSAMYIALSYGTRLAAQGQRTARAEALAREAQMCALRYQVDPHFLFNALNSVSALVVSDRKDDAEEMLKRLSRFFRASVAVDPQSDVALVEEVDLQRRFLEIEQVRFPDMHLDVTVSREVAQVRVPALLLQPLVENAVRFGVASRDGPARIAIRAREEAGFAWVEVENDSTGEGAPGTGTGLRNVAGRLKARFGERARLDAGRIDAGRFSVQLRFPIDGHATDSPRRRAPWLRRASRAAEMERAR